MKITFWIVQNAWSLHDNKLFTAKLSLSIIFVYAVDHELSIPEQPKPKTSPLIIEHKGNSLSIWWKSESKFALKSSNSSSFWPKDR